MTGKGKWTGKKGKGRGQGKVNATQPMYPPPPAVIRAHREAEINALQTQLRSVQDQLAQHCTGTATSSPSDDDDANAEQPPARHQTMTSPSHDDEISSDGVKQEQDADEAHDVKEEEHDHDAFYASYYAHTCTADPYMCE